MPYSKILNIKKKYPDVKYNFNINKIFKFRIITNDNKKGIELNISKETIIFNQVIEDNNWYIYSDKIDFSILNNYKYLVIQLLSDKNYEDNDIIENDTFEITNRNKWYSLSDNDYNIKFYNQTINKDKVVQQVNPNLMYLIQGDAKLIKNIYLKAGKENSTIKIVGFYPNSVNYINYFELKHKNHKNKFENKYENKFVQSINKYTNIENIPKCENIEDVNNRIEMIKFQLKNYFIENNSALENIDCKISDNEKLIKNNIDDIINFELKVSEMKDKIDKLFNKDINQDEKITSMLMIVNDFIRLRDDYEKFKSLISGNINEIVNEKTIDFINNTKSKIIKNNDDSIKENVGILNKKINDLEHNIDTILSNFKDTINILQDSKIDINDVNLFKKEVLDKEYVNNQTYNELINSINNNNMIINESNLLLKNKIDSNVSKIEIIKLNVSEIVNKLNDLIKNNSTVVDEINNIQKRINDIENNNISKNIWSNNKEYLIDEHYNYITVNYNKEDYTYQEYNLYLLQDRKHNETKPYFCIKVKQISQNSFSAKLHSLV